VGVVKSLLLAAVAAVALASRGPADAADLLRAAPADAPSFSWTGCYAGGHVSWLKNASDVTSSPQDGFSAAQIATNTFTYGGDGSNVTGGVQYGCNRQFGNWVLGLDSSFAWAGIDESVNQFHLSPTIGNYVDNLTHKLDTSSTARVRAGWVRDRWMIFVAGGLATGRVESSTATGFVGVPGAVFTGADDDFRFGWTAGGGVEYALAQDWFVRAEYLYVDLGKYSYTSFGPAPLTWRTEVDTQFHVARVALSYRFTRAGSLLEWALGGFKY
jgi:outer membrane immunogenic protein